MPWAAQAGPSQAAPHASNTSHGISVHCPTEAARPRLWVFSCTQFKVRLRKQPSPGACGGAWMTPLCPHMQPGSWGSGVGGQGWDTSLLPALRVSPASRAAKDTRLLLSLPMSPLPAHRDSHCLPTRCSSWASSQAPAASCCVGANKIVVLISWPCRPDRMQPGERARQSARPPTSLRPQLPAHRS